MKNLITLFLLSIGLSVNAQIATNGTNNSGVNASAIGYGSIASNSASTAMGNETTASGAFSTAMGDRTTASGWNSTAMGYYSTASGARSIAMGYYSTASGVLSTAMGNETTASDWASTVIGQYNSSGSTATSATSFSTSAPAFVVGNGTDGSNRSDAFKVMFNGDAYVSNSLYLGGTQITSTAPELNVLDGITASTAELNLLSGATSLGTGILEPVTEGSNTGVRLSSSNAANHGDIGSNAVDLSYSNTASSTSGATGKYSLAMGYETTASGSRATALGNATTANGTHSTALGNTTIASGNVSTAMGKNTTASDFASLVVGQYNSSGSSVTNSATSFNTANAAFVIGNGTDESSRSDAFKVMFNGDAYVSNSLYLGGTQITSTAAELNLLSGVTTLGTGILEPVTENGNTGVRLSSSDAANHGDIGNNAVDLSYSVSSSTTLGATGNYSTAMGYETTASGNFSTAMGVSTTASEFASTAMGYETTASGNQSTAMGKNTTASGAFSTAMGNYTTASEFASTAMGNNTTASGHHSTAMGRNTVASDYASVVIGQYNSSGSTATSATSFSTSAPAFVIGNGTGNSSRSDAFKVMFNGDATVSNDLTVNGDVTVSSDARLKANIVSLGATLSKLLNIDGKTYTVKKNGAQKIGVLAQDIQEVFPELVSEDNEGMLSVNYQGFIPVLINALKEQQKEIEYLRAQEKRIDRLEQLIQN